MNVTQQGSITGHRRVRLSAAWGTLEPGIALEKDMRTALLTLLIGSLIACGDKEDDTSTPEEADADTDSDTDSDADTDSDTDADLVAVDGCVAYDDGTPASNKNVRVQMCNSTGCSPAFPDASGCFSFPGLGPTDYAFDVVPTGEDAGHTYATPLSLVTLAPEQGSWTVEEPVVIYDFTTKTQLSTGTHSGGNGLTIEVDGAQFEGPIEDPDADWMASVSVDPAASGLPLDMFTGEVVAMWYLGPATAKVGPWAFSVDGLGLAEGTQLRAYNASYYDFTWIDLGTVTADADGNLSSDDGVGIAHLSTLILVEE